MAEKYRDPLEDVETGAVSPESSGPEKVETTQHASKDTKPGFFWRSYNSIRDIYSPTDEPPLVLPTCPNDDEKLSYLNKGRITFFSFGISSFLALGSGIWLFTITAPYYHWLGLFAFINCVYLFLSYGIGLIGKDYDYKAHLDRLAAHSIRQETAPTVDIYLPCCHEPLEILQNTYEHIIKLDYPASKLRVYVMDDGNLESVRELARKYCFMYHVRDDRPHLRKAGNVRWNFTRTHGEFFVIFDADCCLRPELVKEFIVEHLEDEKTAIVQTPQWFRSTSDQTWVEQGAGATQELFYRVIQVNGDRLGGANCVGTNAMYRRAALEAVGGTADIGHSEDVHMGYILFLHVETRIFIADPVNIGLVPFTVFGRFLYYPCMSLNLIIGPMSGVLLLALRPKRVKVWNIASALPSYIYGLVILPLWAKGNYKFNTACSRSMPPWAVSGDAKAHKSDKHRNMRIFCCIWVIIVTGAMIGLGVWRLLPGGGLDAWYDPLPLFLFTEYNLYKTYYFVFASW
ncbi:unnamed protein product [Clonostachys chloroleuca]|uniref:Glycosyltransferase 2-like domain-containing protein n=1 Tax=Clonostachys chloroleuca TaxID=1926264 RepID=A0AA35MHR7_9HYPO|nr:unnamed protein product [Clonostachys chloroleuca]